MPPHCEYGATSPPHESSSAGLVLAGTDDETKDDMTNDVVGEGEKVARGDSEEVMAEVVEERVATGVDALTTRVDEDLTTGIEGLITSDGDEVGAVLPVSETSGSGSLALSALTHPVFAVIAAGQETCLKSTVGLSAPINQS
jgi:hypothetical protein